jgi:Domain of unknown function (DUF4340)
VSQKSRNRLNLVLVVVVAALAVLVRFKPGLKHPSADQPLLDFPVSQVADVRLSPAGAPAVELKRVGKDWYLNEPFLYRADDDLVQALLDGLDAARAVPVAGANRDLSRYGLDKPLVRLDLDGHDYAIGAAEPVSNQRYVLAGGRVELTDPTVFYQVSHESYWWLDKHLLPPGSRITALQLPHSTLLPDARGHWQLSPADASVSADAIQKLVDGWQQTSAIGIGPIGKAKSEGEVALQLSGAEKPVRFEILEDPDFLVLARPDLGLEFQLDKQQGKALLEFTTPTPAGTTH